MNSPAKCFSQKVEELPQKLGESHQNTRLHSPSKWVKKRVSFTQLGIHGAQSCQCGLSSLGMPQSGSEPKFEPELSEPESSVQGSPVVQNRTTSPVLCLGKVQNVRTALNLI